MKRLAASAGSCRQHGFTLITTAACLVAMAGVLGLAVDVGRMYIARNEIQAYADSASLGAALELDGTSAGITRALGAVSASINRWNLGTQSFSGTQTDFAADAAGPWESNPNPASGYRFARVRATVNVSLHFIPAVATARLATVNATAIAGQALKTSFNEGTFPFSPFAHNPADPNFGYTVGQVYTLRWGSNPKVGPNTCEGDNAQVWIDEEKEGSSSERGYIEETSSALIRAAIVDDYQTKPVSVGEPVEMTGGNKQTQRDSIIERVNQDTDPSSSTYAAYQAAGQGNGRRLVAVPINTWHPDYVVVGFAAFFLLPQSEYPSGGNKSFCAEYVGPYVEGSRHKGGGGPGAYVVRLVQ